MIVKNEERFLEACLRSAEAAVDEICIIDTGSTDRTVEIARSFGARIEHRTWRNDFAWARNEALAMATKRWIIVLDADEELDPPSFEALRILRAAPADLVGLWVRCNNLSDDYKGTGVSSHALVRVFPNNERIRFFSPVHEFVTLDNKLTGMQACIAPLSITHHGYLSEIVKSRNKAQRNLDLIKVATQEHPEEAFNWYNLGVTSLLCGDPDAAIVALEKMRAMVGDLQRGFIPNALAQLADLYTDRGDYAQAQVCANESLDKAPNYANAHFALARALAKQRRFPEARQAFQAAIDDAPHSARQFIVDDEVCSWKAQSEIGSSYGHEGNDIEALAWFERALRNRPKVVPVRMNRAKALERLGRIDEAQAAFQELAQEEPGDAHCGDFINFLLRQRRYSLALETIEASLPAVTPRAQATLLVASAQIVAQIGGGDIQTLLKRAVAAHGGAADALDALEAYYTARGNRAALDALHADELRGPLEMPADYARRATRHLSSGRLSDAEAVTRAGLAVAPHDAALRYNLGAVLVQTDRKDMALEELASAGSGPGDIGLRASFLSAIVLGELGRYQDALSMIDTVIDRAPREVDARLHRFRFADALRDAATAEATLREALDLGDARVATELAAWLLRQGRPQDARAVAEHALAMA